MRDELLGISPRERDWVVVGASPESLLGRGFRQVGRDFPVFLHPRTGEEYALARTERKSGRGYGGFVVDAAPTVTLEEDLLRRDLTINAMARDSRRNIIDPHGGRADLRSRRLRHVSPAFSEDPLRVLRAARINARLSERGFAIDPETLALMRALSGSGELSELPAERLWVETEKALRGAAPEVYFQVLADCGAIAALCPAWRPSAPELGRLRRAARAGHSLPVRFAALLARQDREAIEAWCDVCKAPRQCRELALLSRARGMDCHCRSGGDALRLLENTDAWRRGARFEEFLQVCALCFGLRDAGRRRLLAARRASLSIDTGRWRARGLSGGAIGERVRESRLRRLDRLYALKPSAR